MNSLFVDMGFGRRIIFNAFEDMPLWIIAVPALIIPHLYREVEYFKKEKKSRFVTNVPMLAVNSIKLIGLFGLLFFIYPDFAG